MSQCYLGGIITANPTLPTLSSASGVWTLEQDFQNSASITPQVIGRSVRLRASASGYFNRVISSTGNQRTLTLSAWVKRGALGASLFTLFGNGAGSVDYIGFNSDSLRVSFAEDTNAAYAFDILSNGFKPRNTFGYANTSGATYIYMAFAENPFNIARAR